MAEKEMGKPDEVRITFRLPADVADGLRRSAKRHTRSLNGEMVVALRTYLEGLKQAGARDDAER